MQRGVLSLILVLNMVSGLVLSAYASEQENPQADTSIKHENQEIINDSEEAFTEGENCIITEIEEQEEINTSTVTAEETEATETEAELMENTVEETELITEIETELVDDTNIETEELDETGTQIEAIDETETEMDMESETTNETETVEESEITTETELDTENAETEIVEESKLDIEKAAVYSVEFPSVDEFRFILDPYGLRGLSQGKSASLEELKSYAGKIYCNKKMMVTNKSSVPIKVRVSIQLTGDINAKESMEEIESDSESNVFMYIIPSQNDLEGNLDNYQQSNLGIVVKKEEPTIFEFILPESKYQWNEPKENNTVECEIADGEKGHSVAFEIAGLINTKTNWKKFDKDGKKIGLKISYSYEDASNQSLTKSQYEGFMLLPYSGTIVNVDETE